MNCHICPFAQELSRGDHAEMPYEQTPCSTCPAGKEPSYAIEYDDDRPAAEEPPRPEPDRDDLLPISVLTEMAAGILRLPQPIFTVVSRRLAGDSFKKIASSEGISIQAAEQRLKAAFRRFPAIAAAFPRKIAKQKTRKRKRKTVH